MKQAKRAEKAPKKAPAERRATISVEVVLPPGVTVRALQRRGGIEVYGMGGSDGMLPLPIAQINGVARAGN